MGSIYFVAGASGSGKTAIIPNLKKILGNSCSVYDFDDMGVPEGADKKWRQKSTEKWLQRLLQENNDVCLLGQFVLGEILACPSAQQIGMVNLCLLDVRDFERIQRLKTRNTYIDDQNTLNWAVWLRMHHYDPQWMQHVLKEDCWDGLNFSIWDRLENWDGKANVRDIDTTDLSVNQVAESIANWVREKNAQNFPELIPNTPYKLYGNIKNAFTLIDEQLFAFNKGCVPATQYPTSIDKHYIVKQDDDMIAGICANIYIWKIMYIELLFVSEAHRRQDLGTLLLRKIEEEAKIHGVTLIHLDTFDFQAKDFYLKQGYEIFGVLEGCPEGHKRYYMKKNLI